MANAKTRAENTMEILIPPLLTAVREVRWRISGGISVKDAFRLYLDDNHDSLAEKFRERWTLKWRSHIPITRQSDVFSSHYQKSFWELIERGCAGQPVNEALAALEDEIERAADAELDQHVASLPFKVLLPLLAFQFPAHLILMLGPMLRELNHHLGSGP